MSVLSWAQAYADNLAAGFSSTAAQIMTAIQAAESNFNTTAINPGSPGHPEYSVGIDQINLDAHPTVTVAQAEDPLQADRYSYQLSQAGTNFTPWSTFDTGAYQQYLGGGTLTPAQSSTMTSGVSTTPTSLPDLNPVDWLSTLLTALTSGLERVGFFVLAAVIIIFGILLVAYEPAQATAQDAIKGAMLS